LQYRLPCLSPSQGENFSSFHVIRVELDPYCLPDDAFNVFGFRGQDSSVLKLDTVTQVVL
jgi:hypothetical protein